MPANGDDAAGALGTLMFVVSPTGQLRVATAGATPSPSDGDTTIWLGGGQASDRPVPPASGASR